MACVWIKDCPDVPIIQRPAQVPLIMGLITEASQLKSTVSIMQGRFRFPKRGIPWCDDRDSGPCIAPQFRQHLRLSPARREGLHTEVVLVWKGCGYCSAEVQVGMCSCLIGKVEAVLLI